MENQPDLNPQNSQQLDNTPVEQTPVPRQKGILLIPILVIFLLSASVFGFGGYLLGRQSVGYSTYQEDQLDSTPSSNVSQQARVVSPSSSPLIIIDKKIYSNQYFTFEYPESWTADTTLIYEHRSDCDPDTFRCANEKNIVDIRSNLTPIYQGYTNSEWFNEIADLTTSWESGRDVFSKLAAGKTQEGKNYVIFKQAPSANFEGEPLTLIIGYVLDNNNLYELRLSHFGTDQEGLNLVKSLIETVKIK